MNWPPEKIQNSLETTGKIDYQNWIIKKMKDLTHLEAIEERLQRAIDINDPHNTKIITKEWMNEVNHIDGDLPAEYSNLTDDELLSELMV